VVIDGQTETIFREISMARCLGRLFKIERTGGFERRPVATVQQLIKRRGTLVNELLRLDGMRRSLKSPGSPELEQALAELAGEVDGSLDHSQTRVERLREDLRLGRGEGMTTGVRDGAIGLVLGRG
jgi:hypothetical protein